jgi:putative ABC transport system ATP-binding protein
MQTTPPRLEGGGWGEGSPRLRIAALHSALAGPFDLSVAAGECVAVSGASGSGKSLFLRMIADLDPNRGEVFLDERERHSFSPPAWRRHVVYSAAEPGWWSERVADHFRGDAMAFARSMAPRVGLDSALLDGPVLGPSTGERQRMALLRVLALNSPVLLLDEPTGALDQEATKQVEDVLRERLAAGTSIILVSHSPEQAARLGHQCLTMAARRFVA